MDSKFIYTPKTLGLNDIILVYNDGISYKSIDINVFNKEPIIYDKFFEGDTYYDISITHCPYSFCSKIYFGKFTKSNDLYNGNIVLIDKDNNMVSQFSGEILFSNIKKYYRRKDVIVMTLRNSLSIYPDYNYMVDASTKPNIVAKEYYENDKLYLSDDTYNANKKYFKNIHPKTLIYGVEYLSTKTGKKKYTAILSKYSSNIVENNYNYKDSGYYKYFKKLLNKLKKKSAVVTPCFWYVWVIFNPDTKIVYLFGTSR